MGKKERINELTNELLQSGDITDVTSLHSILKEMLKQGVETLLESELDEELGYPKHDKQIEKSNYRNGYSGKTVKSDLDEIRLYIPRDRNNEYEPELVPKHSSVIYQQYKTG